MRHILSALLFPCAFVATAAADDGEKLQGTWTFVSFHDSGRDKLGGATARLVITKDRMVASLDSIRSTALEFRFKLDATKSPKWIDLELPGGTRKRLLGIYALEGDELKICYPEGGNERSNAFESKGGRGTVRNDVLWVLKRGAPKAGSEPPKPPELKVLDRIVGRWNYELTAKPAEWSGQGGVTRGTDVHDWALDGRFIHGWRDHDKDHTSMWLCTFDAQSQNYRFWHFHSSGGTSESIGRWDEPAETMRWNVDFGNGVRGVAAWQFQGKARYHYTVRATDATGKVYLDLSAKLTRREADHSAPPSPARHDGAAPAAATPLLKQLDGFVGRWSATTELKPAVWTPAPSASTGVVNIRWVLGGRFLLEHGKHEPGNSEKLLVRTIETDTNALRSWHFDSAGNASQSTGSWHDATRTLRESGVLPNDIGVTAKLQFTNDDTIQWSASAKDAQGTQYLDAHGTLRREK